MSSWPWTDFGWRLDRYNGTFATGRCAGLADRVGIVLGTVDGLQLSNWREIPEFSSNFNTVRWPRG